MLDVHVHGSGWVANAATLGAVQLGLRVGASALPEHANTDMRGIALTPASKALLTALGAWPAQACAVQRMQVHDGASQLEFDAAQGGSDALAHIAEGQAISQAMHAAIAKLSVGAVQWVEKDHAAPAKLHLVCEGANSLLRDNVKAATEQWSYGQTAIGVQLRLPAPHLNTAKQWFLNGEVLALLPMGDRPDTAALVWSVSTSHAHSLTALGDAEFAQALEQAITTAGEAMQGIEMLGVRQTWPLAASRLMQWSGQFESGSNVGQTWLLMGDSAHRIHPLAGQGLNLGLGDVACWQRIWRERQGPAYWRMVNDAKLVRRYSRERQAKADLALGVTDGLFQLMRERTDLPGPLGLAWPKLRQAGLSLFNGSGPVKRWTATQAMR